MDEKSRDESIKLINLSLEVIYCSTTLSIHGPIRLKRFISQLHPGLWNEFCQLSTFNTSN